jgi:hypothetical protein
VIGLDGMMLNGRQCSCKKTHLQHFSSKSLIEVLRGSTGEQSIEATLEAPKSSPTYATLEATLEAQLKEAPRLSAWLEDDRQFGFQVVLLHGNGFS